MQAAIPKTEIIHTNRYYCGAADVAEMVGCSTRKAYSIISALRQELFEANRLTKEYPAGKIPRKYLEERLMLQ